MKRASGYRHRVHEHVQAMFPNCPWHEFGTKHAGARRRHRRWHRRPVRTCQLPPPTLSSPQRPNSLNPIPTSICFDLMQLIFEIVLDLVQHLKFGALHLKKSQNYITNPIKCFMNLSKFWYIKYRADYFLKRVVFFF